ncbi:NADH dehydrogenase [Candidatus Glomeribacter gigasporarum BEG34]|uniref:NADH dehydrogenase n=1 Tax=Candidatus Glomeribacter gigasporarum BEG34 TaxID=1070319 RepID=G2J8D7_9BURK|nr:NAD(P)/FAD-dependent oxidoreductase [Candidatus Glomeribacter gigasporarum]CCD29034.1 NADH dehydrogenase [Candidatus Glomeribacter gigasporarum BEG34]
MHQILIIGGGAGGLELATRLGNRLGKRKKAKIVLADRYPVHVWKPLLHEVAAGSMDPFAHQLEYAAQARWHGFEFQLGECIALDRSAKTITLAAAHDEEGIELLPARTLKYDTLVIAIGSTTNFFNVSGAQQYAIALDTTAQAERFRRRLIATCMRAHTHRSSRASGTAARIQIAIVGGGATGVELSAELRQTAQTLAAYGIHALEPNRDIGITVIESGPRILSALPERVSTETAVLLKKLGIELSVGEHVTEVLPNTLRTASGKTLSADLIVWAAGIQAPAILQQLDGLATTPRGQLKVRMTLQTENDDDIFAFGDCASCPWPAQHSAVPPRAQAAHQQASFLSRGLMRRLAGKSLPAFSYRDFGSLVSLGRFGAVGHLLGGNLWVEGIAARWMYAFLYRMHIAALHGIPRMALDTLAHWLRRSTLPRVKLH